MRKRGYWYNLGNLLRARRLKKSIKQIRERYPADVEAELLFTVLSDLITLDGVKMLYGLKDRGQKYETHPGVLLYTMRLYTEAPEFFKKGNLLFVKNLTNPIEEIYTDALEGFEAATMFMQVAPSGCAGLYYPSMISRQIGNWTLNLLINNKLRIKVQCLIF